MKKVIFTSVLGLCFAIVNCYAVMVCVKSKRVNVRLNSNLKAETVWQSFKNTPLKVVDANKGWYKVVDYAGYTGWVKSYTVIKRKCAIVKKETAFIYSKPAQSSEINWETDKGYPLSVLQVKNGWIKVKDFEGTTGWMQFSDLWGI